MFKLVRVLVPVSHDNADRSGFSTEMMECVAFTIALQYI